MLLFNRAWLNRQLVFLRPICDDYTEESEEEVQQYRSQNVFLKNQSFYNSIGGNVSSTITSQI